MENNGHTNQGPPYLFISGKTCFVTTRKVIIEQIEKNALQQGKMNLQVGPILRRIVDDFREYTAYAEPGMLFQAPEAGISIVRLAAHAPSTVSLSEQAKRNIEAQNEDNPRITTE